jgi:transposase
MPIEFDRPKRIVNNMLIEPDWLHTFVHRGENKVTLLKLAKYYFTVSYLYTRYFLFIDGMQTRVAVVDENGYILWLA